LCTKLQSGGAGVLGALLCVALLPATAGAITGGTAPNRAWPAQALVSIAATATSDARACGGTLVSGRWVLTAGHCVTDKGAPGAVPPRLPAAAITVSLGETDLNQFSPAQRFAVDTVVRDPQFTPRGGTANHDLGLLHLADPTPASPAFEPMRLVSDAETALWAPGTVATVLGWGAAVFRGPQQTQLQQAGVPVITDDACAGAYPASTPNSFDATTMVCAGDGTADTCSGDSGGPLLVPRVDAFALAGVTSYGFHCADPASPGVYVRVGAAAMNAWVRERVPTAAITISPRSPDPGTNVLLTATAGDVLPGTPNFAWDLDDDGQYDDDTGTTATVRDISAGSTVVRVQETYDDGDRALAREVVTTAGSPLPPPPPPPPPPPRPGTLDPVRRGDIQPLPLAGSSSLNSALPPLARLLAGPRRVRVSSLLDGRVSIGVSCSAACALSARLTLDARTAQKIGLVKAARNVLIGTGTKRLRRAGRVTIVIGLKRSAVKALRRAHDGATRVRVTARAGQRIQRLERTITLHS
jgi:secreted trypsin-like serine protease